MPFAGAAIVRRWPVPTAERRGAGRPLHVDDAPSGKVALERARCFLFDLSPGGIGNGGKLAMEIIHVVMSPLREPMPSEPSRTDGLDEDETDAAVSPQPAAQEVAAAGWSTRFVFGHVLQKRRGRHEEQVSGDGAAEIEQPVVVAGRPADEHVLEHLLDGAGRTAVADEIGAKFAVRGPAEGHVVAQDLDLFAVLDDRRERVVR